jgi:NADH-quinone oxidoreductase subunit G
MVVTLSPFKSNMAFSDVLLPIAPFSETPGTFVNAEGRIQGFHAVVKPLGETRPAWKVLRVLANLLNLPGFEYDSAQDVLTKALGAQGSDPTMVPAGRLSNACHVAVDLSPASVPPVTATIYSLDGIVRRAKSLQLTADAGFVGDSIRPGISADEQSSRVSLGNNPLEKNSIVRAMSA